MSERLRARLRYCFCFCFIARCRGYSQNAEKNRVLELLHEFKKSTELKLETVRAGIRPMEDLYTSAKRLDPKKDLKEYFGFNSVLSRQISRSVHFCLSGVHRQGFNGGTNDHPCPTA